MAIYKRGYQRYQGPVTGHLARLLVVPRFAWERIMQQRLVVIVMVLSMFTPLMFATFIYIANHADLLGTIGSGDGMQKFLKIDADFFMYFMKSQAFFSVILAAIAGPSLVAPDLANNALPLYFSRPMLRIEYVIARMLVLAGILSPVTWIPAILLFLMQWSLAGWGWFGANWRIAVGILAGFALWIVLVSLVAMASSAYVKWRIIAGALVLAFFSVLPGAGQLVNSVLRVDWGSLLNPQKDMQQVWLLLLGGEIPKEVATSACAMALALFVAFLLWILEKKIRPVEVVS
jgi:ABC-2 type transport system permease protein